MDLKALDEACDAATSLRANGKVIGTAAGVTLVAWRPGKDAEPSIAVLVKVAIPGPATDSPVDEREAVVAYLSLNEMDTLSTLFTIFIVRYNEMVAKQGVVI